MMMPGVPGGGGEGSRGDRRNKPAGVGDVLKGVQFETRRIGKGGNARIEFFVTGTAEHKILMPDPRYHWKPEPGVSYDVEVTEDTKPGIRKGKLMVRPVAEQGAPIHVERKRENPLPIEIDKKEEKVYVLDTEIPYNKDGGPMVPPRQKFDHFTLDEHTLKILHKVATAVELKKPLLLEGETAATKTSAIEYLGAMTNHEVLRLNMSGQSDTGDMIGKFVPNDGKVQLKFERLFEHVESLSEKSQAIINAAATEGRELSLTEAQMVASEEGIQVPEWRWQDGLLPRAMKTGAWLILDEFTLAEASVRERLNSVLERKPWLTLSENQSESIGEGGDYELDPGFRIFATTNPSTYSGREPLTPAEKRRWTSQLQVPQPNEKSYEAMIEFNVFGNQPEVTIDGVKYQADPAKKPTFEKLRRVPRMKEIATALALFHSQIETLTRDRTIGKSQPEPYVFTRDNLLSMLSFLNDKKVVNRKTGRKTTVQQDPKGMVQRAFKESYLDFMANDDDRKKMNDQFKAVGLHENAWSFS